MAKIKKRRRIDNPLPKEVKQWNAEIDWFERTQDTPFADFVTFLKQTKQVHQEALELYKKLTEIGGKRGWNEYIAANPPSGRVIAHLLLIANSEAKRLAAQSKNKDEREQAQKDWKKHKEECKSKNNRPNKSAFVRCFKKRHPDLKVDDRQIKEVWLK